MDSKEEPSSAPGPTHTPDRKQAHRETTNVASQPSSPSAAQHVANHMELDLPPSYSAPPQALGRSRTSVASPLSSMPGIPPVDFSLYRAPGITVSKDKMKYTTNHPLYSQSPEALLELIKRHAQLPPHPLIRIRGMEGAAGGNTTNMDLKISLLPYIVRPPDAQGSAAWQYVRMLRDGEEGWRGGNKQSRIPQVKGGLEEWTRRYVMEQNKNKSFVLTKEVVNWDTKYLEGQIRSLLHNIGYRGTLNITFPVTHSTLEVKAPKDQSWLEAVASVFKIKDTRRYEVATAVWPYAALTMEEAGGQGNAWAVKSEQQFWWEWKDAIRVAVTERRKGWVSLADQFEAAMGSAWDPKKPFTGAED